jgi:hypothetical protein
MGARSLPPRYCTNVAWFDLVIKMAKVELRACFKSFDLSLRSRRQHKAWGGEPQENGGKGAQAHEVGDS